jgi:uncharacterized protein (TIGR03546 family)
MSLRLIRKLGKIVRGGGSTRDVALGIWLGFALGMVPGVNLTMGLLILLILILNCNIGAVFLSLMLGTAACYGAAEPLYNMGDWLIHDAGFAPLVRMLADTPVLAFLDWQFYCVLSGILCGLAGGFVLAVVFAGMIAGLRRAVIKKKQSSEKVERAAGNPIGRFFLWVFFGGGKGTLEESLEKRSPIFRKSGLVLVSVLVLLVFAGGWAIANLQLEPYVEDAAGKANGAEVNIADFGISLLNGSITIQGVQVTNNSKLNLNRFQADKLGITMSMSALLTKRIVVDKIECLNLQIDKLREIAGKLIDEGVEFPDMGDSLPDLGEGDKSLQEQILDYIKQIQTITKYVGKIREFMAEEPEDKLTLEKHRKRQEELAKAEGFHALSATDILRKHPVWLVRKAEIDVYLVNTFPSVKVILTNLSSDAKLAGVKASFQVLPDEKGLEAYLLEKTGRKGLGTLTVQILKGLDPNASDAEVLRKIITTLGKAALKNPSLILNNLRGYTGGGTTSDKEKKKDIVDSALGGFRSILGNKIKEEEKK